MPLASTPWTTARHATADTAQSCRVVVSICHRQIRSRIVDCLRDLAVSYQSVDPGQLDVRGRAGTLFVLDAEALEGLTDPPVQTMVVFTERSCPLGLLTHVAVGHVIPVRYEHLDPATLSQAIIKAVGADDVSGLACPSRLSNCVCTGTWEDPTVVRSSP